VLVLTNELAGRIETEAVTAAVEVLKTAAPVEVVGCRDEGDMDRVLDAHDGQTVVVAGGDGTLQTAVGRLWRRGEAARRPVGLIPLGTGNDFARGVGIPIDAVQAARLVVNGSPRPVDLIVGDDEGVVVNAVHVGAGAQAAKVARPLKPWLRICAFPVGAVLAGATVRGWRLRVGVDGKPVADGRRRVLMAGVSNAPSIAGGTAELGPDASPVDGVADVTVSFAVGPVARLGYALALRRGRHPERGDVIHLPGREVDISGEPFHVSADGEVSGPFTHRRWRVVPRAWLCILPPRPSAV
jgi:diacylglycerol kinase family enzyme